MPSSSSRNLKRRRALGDHGMGEGVRTDLRRQVAYLAARLMAEGGIIDYGVAKQKAARQAGLTDASALPENREIEVALRSYQRLFQGVEQPAQLLWLRQRAVEVMKLLIDFNPHLVGSVLAGTANEFSEIDLHAFADDSKDVELFLINHRIAYRAELCPTSVGGKSLKVPVLKIEFDGAPISVTVFGVDDIRILRRGDERILGRAKLDDVETLLALEPALGE
jgi:hypothetical protein